MPFIDLKLVTFLAVSSLLFICLSFAFDSDRVVVTSGKKIGLRRLSDLESYILAATWTPGTQVHSD